MPLSVPNPARAPFLAAGLLALCQVAVGSLFLAARFSGYVLAPAEMSMALPYDFAIKTFVLLFGPAQWPGGGALDVFLAPGFVAKLVVARAALLPNFCLALAGASLLTGWALLRRRRLTLATVLSTYAAVGLLLHLGVWLTSGDFAGELDAALIRQRLALDSPGLSEMSVALVGWAASTALALVLIRIPVTLARALACGLSLLTLVAAALPVPPLHAAATVPAVAAAKLTHSIDNVLLISIDSLRADRLGAYGHERPTSPTIDRLARQGVRFAEAMTTAPWTLPAHMSMLTGLYPYAHRVNTEADRLPNGVTTLAQRLGAAGFRTAAVVSEGLVGRTYGFARGFDTFDDETAVKALAEVDEETAPLVLQQAEAWLRRESAGRFFLFLHLWDVHYDFVPPAPYDRMFDPDYRGPMTGRDFIHDDAIRPDMEQRDLDHLLARYDGEIRWVDDHLARLLTILDELGVGERTAVIITADHGEEFFEHGYKGHGAALYRPVMQVPLVIHAPGVAAGRVVDEPVSLVDLVPTILELTGVPLADPLDGISLVPAMTGRARLPQRDVYGQRCSRGMSGCRVMRHSREATLLHRFAPPLVEHYAASDLQQRDDRVPHGEWPTQALGEMATELNQQRARQADVGHAGKTLDAAAKERLRALGYSH